MHATVQTLLLVASLTFLALHSDAFIIKPHTIFQSSTQLRATDGRIQSKPKTVSDKNVLMVLTSHGKIEGTDRTTGYWLSELTHPYWTFINAGCNVDICSVKGGVAPVAPSSIDLSDNENKRFWDSPKLRQLTEKTLPLESFDGKNYKAVFYVGGFGTMWDFPFTPAVDRVSREVYENECIVGAVCHGPIALSNIRLTDGSLLLKSKQVTGFSNAEEDKAGLYDQLPQHTNIGGVDGLNGRSCEEILAACGGHYIKGQPGSCHVVTSDRVVTGQNPQSAAATAMRIVSMIDAR